MNDRIRAVALGNDPADILFKNGRVVDVLTETIYEADVAVADGVIAGVGSYEKAYEVVDLKGAYLNGNAGALLHRGAALGCDDADYGSA